MLLAFAFVLVSCAVGPDYQKPDTGAITPARWKWQKAAPRDTVPKDKWWTIFHDSELNRLESLVVANNQELRAALARFEQGRAYSRAARVAMVPDFNLRTDVKRERTSGNLPTPIRYDIPSAHVDSFSLPLDLAYELDLWGKTHRLIESVRADAEALAAAHQTVLLSLTADLAACYFHVCACDAEISALQEMLALREKSYALIEQRAKAGATNEIDSARAKGELESTRAEVADVKRQREDLVSVMAILCGQPASSFRVSSRALEGSAPSVPAGVPANVLERRPDVASAERHVASCNAKIGYEMAAYFPSVALIGRSGYLSDSSASLFAGDSAVWSAGVSILQPLTGILVTKAKVENARAAHDEAVANYRQAVLGAVKDVEAALSTIHYRREQRRAQNAALAAVRRADELIRKNYEAGTITYLDLLESDRSCILLERQAARLQAQEFVDTTVLIKALGGGW